MRNEMRHRSLRELIETTCRENASRIFLHLPEQAESMTFGEMGRLTENLSHLLSAAGFRKQERVAVLLNNGSAAAVALLGVTAAGGVAVPLNPQLTRSEIDWLLEHSQARFILTDARRADDLLPEAARWKLEIPGSAQQGGAALVLVERLPADPDREAVADTSVPEWAELAIILYTSGTTGKPKGVILTHGNLLSNARGVQEANQLTPEDTALCILPLFHINGMVVTLITSMLAGTSLVLPKKFSSHHFWQWISNYNVSWFSAVPTIFSILLLDPIPSKSEFSSLRFARSASAPLPIAVLEEFEARTGVQVIESYGISEAGGQVTSNPLHLRKPGSVGLPFVNALRIVDEQGVPLGSNQTGEVIIRGPNVSTGYLDNATANHESFRDEWFHTGDLGYRDSDDYVFLVGRSKELINRAGEKIAPREIEEVIYRLPEVESAAVVGVPDSLYGEEVASFLVLRPGLSLTEERVAVHCSESLADFKIPKQVFFVAELPKGPSGKIQRRRLLEMYAPLIESKTRRLPHEEEVVSSSHSDRYSPDRSVRPRAATSH
jgi:acyl-CoA synthetase (AMP-forming)/AMP-acid ligase II